MGDNTQNTGGQDRNRQDQQSNTPRQAPGQQNRQSEGGQKDPNAGESQRIDTDNDGRTRDPNDKSPNDKGESVG